MTKIALAIALVGVLGASPQTGAQKLQQAIDLIESRGDLSKAMPLLDDVSKGTDRPLAARALLYLAQAQERHGKDQARKTYERIIRDFSAQTDIAAQARTRLAALDRAAPSVEGPPAARRIWTVPAGAYAPPQISPDARFLAYSLSGSFHVYDTAGGTTRRVDGYAPGTTGRGANPGGHAFSRDSLQLAYGWALDDREQLRVVALTRRGALQPRVLLDDPEVGAVTVLGWAPTKRGSRFM